jgi:hypothetical protein
MRAWAGALAAIAGFFALSGSTCTSSFSETDLVTQDLDQDKAAAAEVKNDEQVGEQGGQGKEETQEQIDATDGGSGADF